jgi:hypothetical protein
MSFLLRLRSTRLHPTFKPGSRSTSLPTSPSRHIFYDLAAETIRVDRNKSSLLTGFDVGTEAGKMRLWNVPSGKTNQTKLEKLALKMFVDNSIVEVSVLGLLLFGGQADSMMNRYMRMTCLR